MKIIRNSERVTSPLARAPQYVTHGNVNSNATTGLNANNQPKVKVARVQSMFARKPN